MLAYSHNTSASAWWSPASGFSRPDAHTSISRACLTVVGLDDASETSPSFFFNRSSTALAGDPFIPSATGDAPELPIAETARLKMPCGPATRWSMVSSRVSVFRNGSRHCPGCRITYLILSRVTTKFVTRVAKTPAAVAGDK